MFGPPFNRHDSETQHILIKPFHGEIPRITPSKMGKKNILKRAGQKLTQWGAVGYAGYEVGQMQNEDHKIVVTPQIKIEKNADEINITDIAVVLIAIVILVVLLAILREVSKCVKAKLDYNHRTTQQDIQMRQVHVNNA